MNHSFDPESYPCSDFESLAGFSRFRRYPGFSLVELSRIIKADLCLVVNRGGRCIAGFEGSRPVVVGWLSPLEWDSKHFGIPMARLGFLRDSSAPRERVVSFITALTRELLSGGVNCLHVSAEVDIDDYLVLNVLLGEGFELLDLRRTYCTNRMRADIDFIRMRSRVRSFRREDADPIREIVGQTSFPSRFSRDQFLSFEKVSSMYKNWFENLMAGAGDSTNVVVYERGGKVVACGGIGELDFGYAGLDRTMRSGSLFAGREDAVGAYMPVLYQLIVEALDSHGLVDTTASMNNVTVCRVLEAFRSYKSACASYSLRLWRGDNAKR